MHAEEDPDERVALWLVEDGEEVCAAGEQQRSGVVDGVQEIDRRDHQRAQDDHQPGQSFVHSLE